MILQVGASAARDLNAMNPDEHLRILTSGDICWFSDWPSNVVPRHGAIVYTIWDKSGRFIYVGMSGRGTGADSQPNGKQGPWGRLNSHASGRRSGDQFCIYICDRLVLSTLHNRITEISDGTLSLDQETRTYIRENLGFRWVKIHSGKGALALERLIQKGLSVVGQPLLNPLGRGRAMPSVE